MTEPGNHSEDIGFAFIVGFCAGIAMCVLGIYLGMGGHP